MAIIKKETKSTAKTKKIMAMKVTQSKVRKRLKSNSWLN